MPLRPATRRTLASLGISLASLSATFAVAAPARADTVDDVSSEVRSAVERVWNEQASRIRRAIAFGPEAGAAGVYATRPGDVDGSIALGLGLYVFHVPTLLDAREAIVERTKARLREKLEQLVKQGAQPTQDDIVALARQIFEDVKAEVMGTAPREGKLLESPIAGLVVEVGRQFRAEAWQLRVTPSVGIGPVSVGPTLVAHAGPSFTGLVGGELSLRLLPQPGPTSPVVDTFVRFEAPFARRAENSDQLSVGVRLLLDVI